MSLAGAWALSIKPAVALMAAFSDVGCLAGHNAAGVPHIAPTIATLALLGHGWVLWADDRSFYRLFGWVFLVGSSMFATVPLYLGAGFRLPMWEWPVSFVLLAFLGVRLYVALRSSKSAVYRFLATFAGFVLGTAFLAPLAGPISPLYVAFVSMIAFGGTAALIVMLAWTHHQDRRYL